MVTASKPALKGTLVVIPNIDHHFTTSNDEPLYNMLLEFSSTIFFFSHLLLSSFAKPNPQRRSSFSPPHLPYTRRTVSSMAFTGNHDDILHIFELLHYSLFNIALVFHSSQFVLFCHYFYRPSLLSSFL